MHRVLSFQMGMGRRGFGESSEFVTKRMCFSFIFFIGFLALLGGFLLGKITTERIFQNRDIKNCLNKSVGTNLVIDSNDPRGHDDGRSIVSDHDDLLLKKLRERFAPVENSHFTRIAEKHETTSNVDIKNLETALSSLNLFNGISNSRSSLVATLNGSNEHDRLIVLSLSGDGIKVGIELAKIYAELHNDHNWQPQRTIVFCFFDQPYDSCSDHFSKRFKSRILAYLAVHGKVTQKKGCLVTAGSDIVKYFVLNAAEESVSDKKISDHGTLESCREGGNYHGDRSWLYLPRLVSDVPHASLSFRLVSNSSESEEPGDEETEILGRRETLIRTVGLGVWKLSETPIIHWNPRNFEENVETGLGMLNSSQFVKIREKISSTLRSLTINAESLNERINNTRRDKQSSPLAGRMINDLLMNLDRALLCPDIDSRSKTDLARIPELLTSSKNSTYLFLENLSSCYDDALAVLREG